MCVCGVGCVCACVWRVWGHMWCVVAVGGRWGGGSMLTGTSRALAFTPAPPWRRPGAARPRPLEPTPAAARRPHLEHVDGHLLARPEDADGQHHPQEGDAKAVEQVVGQVVQERVQRELGRRQVPAHRQVAVARARVPLAPRVHPALQGAPAAGRRGAGGGSAELRGRASGSTRCCVAPTQPRPPAGPGPAAPARCMTLCWAMHACINAAAQVPTFS